MLQIRSNQVTQFQNASFDAFAERLMKYLRREFPDGCRVSDEKQLPIVKDLILAAHAWNFRTEHHIAVYSLAQWLHGLTLERDHAEVRALLEDRSFTLDEKSQWLERWVQAHGTRGNHSREFA